MGGHPSRVVMLRCCACAGSLALPPSLGSPPCETSVTPAKKVVSERAEPEEVILLVLPLASHLEHLPREDLVRGRLAARAGREAGKHRAVDERVAKDVVRVELEVDERCVHVV